MSSQEVSGEKEEPSVLSSLEFRIRVYSQELRQSLLRVAEAVLRGSGNVPAGACGSRRRKHQRGEQRAN